MRFKDYTNIIFGKFKGFSWYITIGKNKGFNLLKKDGPSIRTNLWGVSFCIAFLDIEDLLGGLLKELKERDEKEEILKKETKEFEIKQKQLEENILIFNSDKDAFKEKKNKLENVEVDAEESQGLHRLQEFQNYKNESELRIKKLEEQISDLNDEITDLSEVNEENDGFREKIEDMEKDLKETDKEQEKLIEENENYLREIINLTDENIKLDNKIDSLESPDVSSTSSDANVS